MTQTESIRSAIKHLELAIYAFPDKDDRIRRDNEAIDGMIAMLKIIINDLSYD